MEECCLDIDGNVVDHLGNILLTKKEVFYLKGYDIAYGYEGSGIHDWGSVDYGHKTPVYPDSDGYFPNQNDYGNFGIARSYMYERE